MPVRAQQYAYRELHPIFQMNMPEGYLLEQLRQRFAKTTAFDPLLLAITGRTALIGRVHIEVDIAVTPGAPPRGERLGDILAWDGAESIFDALAERYLLRSGVSGVQPQAAGSRGHGFGQGGDRHIGTDHQERRRRIPGPASTNISA